MKNVNSALLNLLEEMGQAPRASSDALSHLLPVGGSSFLNNQCSDFFVAPSARYREPAMSVSEESDSSTDSMESAAMEFPVVGEATGAQTPFSSTIDRMWNYVQSHSKKQPHQHSGQINANEGRDLVKTAPIFTAEVGKHVESKLRQNQEQTTLVEQYGLIGVRESPKNLIDDDVFRSIDTTAPQNDLVIANMDAPWSAFICGSQGAGKSHTLSCLLENALLKETTIGQLPNPLAAMVFHYDTYTSQTCSQICEAAYLCTSGIPVTVLVSPSNIWAMTQLYKNLPGLPTNAPKPKVVPLYLSESLLDISTMLKLMAIDPSADFVPLYMETIMSMLREMAMEGKGTGNFSYNEFRSRLEATEWAPGQQVPLNLRLQLLDSFLEPTKYTRSTRPAPSSENIWSFEPGTLTIVDLSDPFVNSDDACSLFSICLSLFMDDRGKCGRVVALDEAHKFLLRSGAAKALTAELTSVIRQQRHTGTRVIIATQEPTLSPDLIDLSNATFVHRFLSPAWYEILKKHLAGASKHDSRNQGSLFDIIVGLETGEALLFCPTALSSVETSYTGSSGVKMLGNGYMKIKIRSRVTADGGRSILASETINTTTDLVAESIPMHVINRPPAPASTAKGKYRNTPSAQTATVNPSVPSTTVPSSTTAAPLPRPPPTAPAAMTTHTVNNPPRFTLTVELKARMKEEAVRHMKIRVAQYSWKVLDPTNVEVIIRDVEKAVGLPYKAIQYGSKMYNCIYGAASNQFGEVRQEAKNKTSTG